MLQTNGLDRSVDQSRASYSTLSSSPLDPTAPAFQCSSTSTSSSPRKDGLKGWEHALAFDVETTGPVYALHSMVAIGGVVMRVVDKTVLSQIRIIMRIEKGHGFSARCKRVYWNNWKKYPVNQRLLREIKKEGGEPKKGIQRFAKWLDQQEETWEKLVLITDNSAFDAGWISHYFWKYLQRLPMCYRFGKESNYRPMLQSNHLRRGLVLDDGTPGQWRGDLRMFGLDSPAEEKKDHDPLNDAKWIAASYADYLNFVRRFRHGSCSSVHSHSAPEWDRVAADHRETLRERQARIAHQSSLSKPLRIQFGTYRPAISITSGSDDSCGASLVPFWKRRSYVSSHAHARDSITPDDELIIPGASSDNNPDPASGIVSILSS